MTQREEIRSFVAEALTIAKGHGATTITFKASKVAEAMGIPNNHPNVIEALTRSEMLSETGFNPAPAVAHSSSALLVFEL